MNRIFQMVGKIEVENTKALQAIQQTQEKAQKFSSFIGKGFLNTAFVGFSIAATQNFLRPLEEFVINPLVDTIKEIRFFNDEMQQALNSINKTLNVSGQELRNYQRAMEEIYTTGYGQSLGEVGTFIEEINHQLGALEYDELVLMGQALDMVQTHFQVGYKETLNTASSLMNHFGLTATGAMDYVIAGFQNGLNASDDFLGTIREYSPQFKEAGFSIEEMFAILNAGLEGGALGTDRIADMVKEGFIRIKDDSVATKQALEDLGYNADEFLMDINSGAISMSDAMVDVAGRLNQVDGEIEKSTIGVALFGTQFEDLAFQGEEALLAIEDGLEGVSGSTERLVNSNFTALQEFSYAIRELKVALTPLISFMDEMLRDFLPHFRAVIDVVRDMVARFEVLDEGTKRMIASFVAISTLFPTIILVFGTLVGIAGTLISPFLAVAAAVILLRNRFKEAFENILAVVKNTVTNFFAIGKNAVQGFIDGFVSGDIGKIVVERFKAVVDAVKSFLGISSPSKLFRWIAEMIAAGLGEGFDADQIYEKMMAFWQKVVDTFNYLRENILPKVQAGLKDLAISFDAFAQSSFPDWLKEVYNTLKDVIGAFTGLSDKKFSIGKFDFELDMNIPELVADIRKRLAQAFENSKPIIAGIAKQLGQTFENFKPLIEGIITDVSSLFPILVAGAILLHETFSRAAKERRRLHREERKALGSNFEQIVHYQARWAEALKRNQELLDQLDNHEFFQRGGAQLDISEGGLGFIDLDKELASVDTIAAKLQKLTQYQMDLKLAVDTKTLQDPLVKTGRQLAIGMRTILTQAKERTKATYEQFFNEVSQMSQALEVSLTRSQLSAVVNADERDALIKSLERQEQQINEEYDERVRKMQELDTLVGQRLAQARQDFDIAQQKNALAKRQIASLSKQKSELQKMGASAAVLQRIEEDIIKERGKRDASQKEYERATTVINQIENNTFRLQKQIFTLRQKNTEEVRRQSELRQTQFLLEALQAESNEKLDELIKSQTEQLKRNQKEQKNLQSTLDSEIQIRDDIAVEVNNLVADLEKMNDSQSEYNLRVEEASELTDKITVSEAKRAEIAEKVGKDGMKRIYQVVGLREELERVQNVLEEQRKREEALTSELFSRDKALQTIYNKQKRGIALTEQEQHQLNERNEVFRELELTQRSIVEERTKEARLASSIDYKTNLTLQEQIAKSQRIQLGFAERRAAILNRISAIEKEMQDPNSNQPYQQLNDQLKKAKAQLKNLGNEQRQNEINLRKLLLANSNIEQLRNDILAERRVELDRLDEIYGANNREALQAYEQQEEKLRSLRFEQTALQDRMKEIQSLLNEENVSDEQAAALRKELDEAKESAEGVSEAISEATLYMTEAEIALDKASPALNNRREEIFDRYTRQLETLQQEEQELINNRMKDNALSQYEIEMLQQVQSLLNDEKTANERIAELTKEINVDQEKRQKIIEQLTERNEALQRAKNKAADTEAKNEAKLAEIRDQQRQLELVQSEEFSELREKQQADLAAQEKQLLEETAEARKAAEDEAMEFALAAQERIHQAREEQLKQEREMYEKGQQELKQGAEGLRTNISAVVGGAQILVAIFSQFSGENQFTKFLQNLTDGINEGRQSALGLIDAINVLLATFAVVKAVIMFRNLLVSINFIMAGSVKMMLNIHTAQTQLAASRAALNESLVAAKKSLITNQKLWIAQASSIAIVVGLLAGAIALYTKMEGVISKATAVLLGFTVVLKAAHAAAFLFGETIEKKILASITPLLAMAASLYGLVMIFQTPVRPAVKLGVAILSIGTAILSVIKVLKVLGFISSITWASILGPVTGVIAAIAGITAIIIAVRLEFAKFGEQLGFLSQAFSSLSFIPKFFNSIGKSIRSWFAEEGPKFGKWAKGVGRAIVNGLAQTTGIKQILNIFSPIVDAIKGNFESGLEMRSPSKVFAYYGRMILSGLFSALNPIAIAKRFIELAAAGVNAFRKFLGINSDSRAFIEAGQNITGGLDTGVSGYNFEGRMGDMAQLGVDAFSRNSVGMEDAADLAMRGAEIAVQDSEYQRILLETGKAGVEAYRSSSRDGMRSAADAMMREAESQVANSDYSGNLGRLAQQGVQEFNRNSEDIKRGAENVQQGLKDAVRQGEVTEFARKESTKLAREVDDRYSLIQQFMKTRLSFIIGGIERTINLFLSIVSGLAMTFIQLARGNWKEAWQAFINSGVWGLDNFLKFGLFFGEQFNNMINRFITNIQNSLVGANPFGQFLIDSLMSLKVVRDTLDSKIKEMRNWLRGLVGDVEATGFHVFNVNLGPLNSAFVSALEFLYDNIISVIAKLFNINEAKLIAMIGVLQNALVGAIGGLLVWTANRLNNLIDWDEVKRRISSFANWLTSSNILNEAVKQTVVDVGAIFAGLPRVTRVATLAIIGHFVGLKQVIGLTTGKIHYFGGTVLNTLLRLLSPTQAISAAFVVLGKTITSLTTVTTGLLKVINLVSFAPPIIGAFALVAAAAALLHHLLTAEEGMQKTIKTVGLLGAAFLAATVVLKKQFIQFFGNSFTALLLNASKAINQWARKALLEGKAIEYGRAAGKKMAKRIGTSLLKGLDFVTKPLRNKLVSLAGGVNSAFNKKIAVATLRFQKSMTLVFTKVGAVLNAFIVKVNAAAASMIKFGTPIAIIVAAIMGLVLVLKSGIHPIAKLVSALGALSIAVVGVNQLMKALGIQAAITWQAVLGPISLVVAGAVGVVTAFTTMKDSMARLGTVAASIGAIIAGLVIVLGGGWVAALAGVAAGIVAAIVTNLEGAKEFLVKLPGWMMSLGKNIVKGLWWGLKALPLFGPLFQAIENGWNWIVGFFQTKSPSRRFEDLGYNLIMGLINGLKGMHKALLDVIGQIFSGDFHGKVIKALKKVITIIFDILDPKQVARVVKELGAHLAAEFKNWGAALVDVLSQSKAGRVVLAWTQKIVQGFQDGFAAITSPSFWKNIGDKIKDGFKTIFSFSPLGLILRFLNSTEIGQKALQAGKSITDGILKGLGSFDIGKTLVEKSRGAWQAFKDFWQINSPSGKTQYAGEMLGEGMSSGVDKGNWGGALLEQSRGAWDSFRNFWGINSESATMRYGGEMMGQGITSGLGNMLGPFQSMLGNFLPEGFLDAASNYTDRIGRFLTGGYEGLLKSQARLENELGALLQRRQDLLDSGLDATNPAVQALNESIDKTVGKLANVDYQMQEAWDVEPIRENIATIDELIAATEASIAAAESRGETERAEAERENLRQLREDRAKLEEDIALAEQRQTENLERNLNERQQLSQDYMDEVNVMGSRQRRDEERAQRRATRNLKREMEARLNAVKQFTEAMKDDMELAEVQIQFGFQDEGEYIESLRQQSTLLTQRLQEEFDAGDVGTDAFKEVASALDTVNSRIKEYDDGLKEIADMQYELDRQSGKIGREAHIANLEEELAALVAVGEQRQLNVDEQKAILELRTKIRDERQALADDEIALIESRHQYELATNQASLEDYRRIKLEQLRAAVAAAEEGTQAYYDAQMALIEFEREVNDENKAVLDARLSYQRTINQGDVEATRELMNEKISILKEELSNMSEGTAEYWQKKEEIYNAEKELAEEVSNQRMQDIEDEIDANNRLFDQRESALDRERSMLQARQEQQDLLAESGRRNYELEKERIDDLEDFAEREHELALQRLESETALNLEKAQLIQNDEERAEEITRIEEEAAEQRRQINHDFTIETMGLANERTQLEMDKIQEVLDFEKAIYEERMSLGDVGEQEVKANFSMEFDNADSLSAQFSTVKDFIGDIQSLYEQDAEERIASMERVASARKANFDRQKELENARLNMSLSVSEQAIEQAKFEQEIQEQLIQDNIDANEHAYEMNKARMEREIVLAQRRGASEEEISQMQLDILAEEQARIEQNYNFKLEELRRTSQIQKEQLIADSEFSIESERRTTEAEIEQNRLAAKMERDILRNSTEVKIQSLEQGLEVALATIEAEMQARMAAGDISASQYAKQQSALNAIRADNEDKIIELRQNTNQQLRDMEANARNQEIIAREQLNLNISQQEQQLANELLKIDTDVQTQSAALQRQFESDSLKAAQAHEDAKWEAQKAASERRVARLEEEQARSKEVRDRELEDFNWAQDQKEVALEREHEAAMAAAKSDEERSRLRLQREQELLDQQIARMDQEAALREQAMQQEIADINRLAEARKNVEGADIEAIERERAEAVKAIQQNLTDFIREQSTARETALIEGEGRITTATLEEQNNRFAQQKAKMEEANAAYAQSNKSVIDMLTEGSAQRLNLARETAEQEFAAKSNVLEQERAMLEEQLNMENLTAEQIQEIQKRLNANQEALAAAGLEKRQSIYDAEQERIKAQDEKAIERMKANGATEVEIANAKADQRIAAIQRYIDFRKESGDLTKEQEEALSEEIKNVRKETADEVKQHKIQAAEEAAEKEKEITQQAIDEETEAIEKKYQKEIEAVEEASNRRIASLERQKDALDETYGDEESVAKIRKRAEIEIKIEREKVEAKIETMKLEQKMQRETTEMIIKLKRAAGMITKEEEQEMREDLKTSEKETNEEIKKMKQNLQKSITSIRNQSYRDAHNQRQKDLAERKKAEAEALQDYKNKQKERLETQRDQRDREIDREYEAAQHRIAIYEKEMERKKNLLEQHADNVSRHYDQIEAEMQFNRSMEDQLATEAMNAFERDIERQEMLGTLTEEERLNAIRQRYEFEEQAMAAQQQRLAEDAAMAKARARDEHAVRVQLINLESEIEINKAKMAMKAEQRKVNAQISNMQNFVNMMQRLGMMTEEAANEAKQDMKDMQNDLKQQQDLHNQELALMQQNRNMQINSANQELNDSLLASDREYQIGSRQLMEQQREERFAFEQEMHEANQKYNEARAESNKRFEEQMKNQQVRAEQNHQNTLDRIKQETDARKKALDENANNQKQHLSELESREKASLNKRLDAEKRYFDAREAARKEALDKQLSVREKMQDFAARKAAAKTEEEREKIKQEYISWLEELEKKKRIEEARRNPDAAELNRMANQIKDLGGIDVGDPLVDARDARKAAEKAAEERRRKFEEELAAKREKLEKIITDKYEQKRMQIEQNVAREKERLDAQAAKGEKVSEARLASAEKRREGQRIAREQAQRIQDQAWAEKQQQKLAAAEARWEREQERQRARAEVIANREQARIDAQRNAAITNNSPKPPAFIGGSTSGGGGDSVGTVVNSASLVGNKTEFGKVEVIIQGDPGMTEEDVAKAVQTGVKNEFMNVANRLRQRAGGGTYKPGSIGDWK